MLELVLNGVSTRRYASVLPELADQVGISKSEVSRETIEAGTRVLAELAERDLSDRGAGGVVWSATEELTCGELVVQLESGVELGAARRNRSRQIGPSSPSVGSGQGQRSPKVERSRGGHRRAAMADWQRRNCQPFRVTPAVF